MAHPLPCRRVLCRGRARQWRTPYHVDECYVEEEPCNVTPLIMSTSAMQRKSPAMVRPLPCRRVLRRGRALQWRTPYHVDECYVEEEPCNGASLTMSTSAM